MAVKERGECAVARLFILVDENILKEALHPVGSLADLLPHRVGCWGRKLLVEHGELPGHPAAAALFSGHRINGIAGRPAGLLCKIVDTFQTAATSAQPY